MFGLPETTEFNRRIPKQKFYDKIFTASESKETKKLKKVFTEQIKAVYWRNKIAASTMNLAPGAAVTELQVFEIRLNSPAPDENLLRLMDRAIPYHILFILEYGGRYKAAICYKEESAGKQKFKVVRFYSTEWLAEDALSLRPEGLTLDNVYENYVRQIAGEPLAPSVPGETLKESVLRDEKRRPLLKQIEKLRKKIKKEKQFNKQVEMNTELKTLKKELERLG